MRLFEVAIGDIETVDKMVRYIDHNTPGFQLNLQGIRKLLQNNGVDYYYLEELDPSQLDIEFDDDVEVSDAIPDKGPIVVNNGFVVDGRHRAKLAKMQNKPILAYNGYNKDVLLKKLNKH